MNCDPSSPSRSKKYLLVYYKEFSFVVPLSPSSLDESNITKWVGLTRTMRLCAFSAFSLYKWLDYICCLNSPILSNPFSFVQNESWIVKIQLVSVCLFACFWREIFTLNYLTKWTLHPSLQLYYSKWNKVVLFTRNNLKLKTVFMASVNPRKLCSKSLAAILHRYTTNAFQINNVIFIKREGENDGMAYIYTNRNKSITLLQTHRPSA